MNHSARHVAYLFERLTAVFGLPFIGAELADQYFLALYDKAGLKLANVMADPDRRQIHGLILSASGVSGTMTGDCTVFFERELRFSC